MSARNGQRHITRVKFSAVVHQSKTVTSTVNNKGDGFTMRTRATRNIYIYHISMLHVHVHAERGHGHGHEHIHFGMDVYIQYGDRLAAWA